MSSTDKLEQVLRMLRDDHGILHVCVDYTGGQLTFDYDDLPLRSSAGPIELHNIADLMQDPNAWMEFDTEVERQPGEDVQPWEVEEQPVRKARGRLYGRGVIAVMVVLRD